MARPTLASLGLPVLLLALGALAAEEGAPAQPRPITDSVTLRLMGEVVEAAEASKGRSDDPVIGVDVPTDGAHGADYWSGLLQVVQVSDPLLTEQCRKQAVSRALEVTGKPQMIRGHMVDSIHKWDDAMEGSKPIRMSEYLAHLAECKDFCRPLMGLLLRCHADAVRANPHLIVFFQVDEPRPGETHRRALSRSSRDELELFAREMNLQNRDLVLYPRASILGATESYAHNRRLTRRRSLAIERALREVGFRGRIVHRAVGWEPPRLAVREISSYFGFDHHWSEMQNPQYMDQSVVVVGF
jgi:hypothetical protein